MPNETQPPPMLPAGTLVALTTHMIESGKFVGEIDSHLTEANRVLETRRLRGERGGACKITATIDIEDDPDLEHHVRLTWSVQTKTPKHERTSIAKTIGGVLLVAPDGSRSESPDQLRLFDAFGRPIGALDPLTGAITPTKDTLGKVGRGAS